MKRGLVRIAAVGFVALAALFWLDRHPVRLDSKGPEAEAAFPARDTGHGVLLVVDASLLERAPATVHERVHDLEWDNLLRQRFGGTDLVDVARLRRDPASVLRDRQFLVLPAQTFARLPLSFADTLDRAVEGGLTIYVETPDSTWAERLGLRIATVETRPRMRWPLTPRPANGLAVEPDPIALPYTSWRYAPTFGSGAPARMTRSVHGRPELWSKPLGSGAWYVCAVDFGRLASSLRQGVPDSDFRVRDRHPEILSGPVETNDLVLAPELLQSDEAWLDAWVDALLAPDLASESPWPTLDPAAAGSDGWLLVSHDDEGFGDLSRWITRDQARRGVPATGFFWSPPTRLTEAGLDSMIRHDGLAPGLHPRWPSPTMWDDPRAPRRMGGFWKIQPYGRLLSFHEQLEALRAVLPPGEEITVTRNHFLLWSEDVDQVWREVAGAGLRADSSFGPDWGAAGWLFGSTVPFRPLDRHGRAFDLWEVPYQSAEIIGGMSAERLERWMETNAAAGRGPIHLLFHPDAYGWVPSADLFRFWDAVPDLARAHRHRPVTLPAFLDWWEARAATRLHWHRDGDTLVVRVELPEAGAEDLALTLPFAWQGRRLVDWSSTAEVGFERGRTRDEERRRFFLPSTGTVELRAVYRAP